MTAVPSILQRKFFLKSFGTAKGKALGFRRVRKTAVKATLSSVVSVRTEQLGCELGFSGSFISGKFTKLCPHIAILVTAGKEITRHISSEPTY